MRAVCITCGGAHASVKGIEGDTGLVKAETCDECRTYAKMLYQCQGHADRRLADDLATLALDVLVAEADWAATHPIRCCSQGNAGCQKSSATASKPCDSAKCDN